MQVMAYLGAATNVAQSFPPFFAAASGSTPPRWPSLDSPRFHTAAAIFAKFAAQFQEYPAALYASGVPRAADGESPPQNGASHRESAESGAAPARAAPESAAQLPAPRHTKSLPSHPVWPSADSSLTRA